MSKFPSAARKPPRRRLTHSVRAGLTRVRKHRRTWLEANRRGAFHLTQASAALAFAQRLDEIRPRIASAAGTREERIRTNAGLLKARETAIAKSQFHKALVKPNAIAARTARRHMAKLVEALDEQVSQDNPKKTSRGIRSRKMATLMRQEK